ncbi:hypothetical protein [Massilia antarctica]|uniref:hypothetical protein n=1 Tax=Massilia antarctica TaxID=2765360 RepID=UPI0006BB9350|nr:hypothetical protein [Massilia sp. H27-R4]MCY0915526.1 hypothetical protein [Massilia sp. H27-R4]CUI04123.1 hypothetical protein BN2497_3023 [Janthinobacterium sp. CG23_2]CUU27909.1 hypothetical protein BN3177_3023 [Janthinobacterium sp. CG23_2]
MSWDVLVCKFSRTYTHVDQIGNHESFVPMGSRAEIQAAISDLFADTGWSDPTCGDYQGPAGSVGFNLSDDDPVNSVMLHVRAGEAIIAPIVALCLRHGWQAMDTSAGTFVEQAPVPEQGLRQWRAYRDQIAGQGQQP